ncbi:hypothetical protein NDU88_009432 [Pleurodeles waltl]|uniref:Uncharacterized protein n=1 Tax=Pleurodeles waltl TaxID=8319 RepID=A0AAV7RWJ9_PLEWA|nr:hypothetical protein NDU88_009432 [Pleurodeles waltl]
MSEPGYSGRVPSSSRGSYWFSVPLSGMASSCLVLEADPSVQGDVASGLQPRGALCPQLAHHPSCTWRAERCAGGGQDRKRAQENGRLRGAPFVPEPCGFPQRRQALTRPEAAAPRSLSGCHAAILISSELLLRNVPGRQHPLHGTLRSTKCPRGDICAPAAPLSTARPCCHAERSVQAAISLRGQTTPPGTANCVQDTFVQGCL